MAVESPQPVKDPNYHYQEASVTPPVFFGNGAERLGIAGMHADTPEGKQVYMNLFHGYSTSKDGEQVELLHYRRKDRRGAFEYILNDPKDPSILREIGGDERIDGIRDKARSAVARYIEKHAEVKVTKKAEVAKHKPKVGKLVRRKPDNLVMVLWTHPATREGDLGNHGHLEIKNLSFDQQEGIYKGIELYHIGSEKLGKLYSDTMRKGLNELGYRTRAKGKEYEVIGVPAELKAVFSRRRNGISEKIEAFEQKKGIKLTPEAKRRFGVYDRPEKSPDMPLKERRKGWIARLSASQLTSIRNVVKAAKDAVFQRGVTAWQKGISAHATQLMSNAYSQENDTPYRGRNDGRGI